MKAVDVNALQRLFEQAREQAEVAQRPVLTVYACPAPGLDPLHLYACHRQGFFWSAQPPGLTLFGLGCEWQTQASGPQRMAQVQQQWTQLCGETRIEGSQPALLFGGLRFDEQRAPSPHWDGFADASFHLAHWLVSEDVGGRWLRCQRCIHAHSDPQALAHDSLAVLQTLLDTPPAASPCPGVIERNALPALQWQAKVESALQAIDSGELNKVVLARHVEYQLDAPLDSAAVMRRLYDQRARAHLFAVHRGAKCFMGATPERLLACRDGHLLTHALAGSARRGTSAAADEALGAQLLADAKEQHEHHLVVQAICEGLQGLVSDLQVAPCPTLLKLGAVQHLSTPIQAHLYPGRSVLDGLEALHPTPAVGGLPKAGALHFIRRHEGFDRGWYAAPVGWLDNQGNGDFVVALRSALLTPQGCHLFAGCGIVQGSRPANEYEETQIKLTGMEQALALAQR